jgi:hypothetical protein
MTSEGFITDLELDVALTGVFKTNPGELTQTVPAWLSVLYQANAQAYARIMESFLSRGFSLAQIQAWDYGKNYQTMIGLYLALTLGSELPGAADKPTEKYQYYLDNLPNAMLVSGGTIS